MGDNWILRVPASGVLRNDSDADGVPLAASLVNDVSFGVLQLLPDGAFSYTPEPDFVGGDSFTYVAHDGLYDSDIAVVTITVVDVDIKYVVVDIEPGSDRNWISFCSEGVLPVTILGSADCDVTEIDVSSLFLEAQVAPLRWRVEGETDGYRDLRLEFDAQAVNDTLRHPRVGQTYELWITGTLMDGTPITGSDFVVAVSWSRLNEGKGRNE